MNRHMVLSLYGSKNFWQVKFKFSLSNGSVGSSCVPFTATDLTRRTYHLHMGKPEILVG